MSKERYAEHTIAWELPNGDSVTKSNYNLADIETKYIPIQTEIISDNKDKIIAELQQRIAELEEQLKNVIMLNLKVGQEVYVIENKNIFKDILEKIEITEDGILFYVEEGIYGLEENEIFATLEEAQVKLEELRGE